jgi:Flp pilus assembly protein TadB
MSVLLAVALAALATWLWLTPWDPTERLARLGVRRSSHDRPRLPGRTETGILSDQSAAQLPSRAGQSARRLGADRAIPGAGPGAGHRVLDGPDRPASIPHDRPVLERTAHSGRAMPHPASSRPPDRSGRDTKVERGQRLLREALCAFLAALGGFLIVGGLPGLITGACTGIVIAAVGRRREPAEVRRRQARIAADLPFALDLMVSCLRAGQPVSGAVEAAAEAMGGPVGERLAWVHMQLRLGARPEQAWSALEADRPLAAMARGMTRAALSGAPVADVLSRLADDTRQEARAASSAAARRVGVQVVAPLGLCFLPAFVFLGIIPVVAGLAGQVFGD